MRQRWCDRARWECVCVCAMPSASRWSRLALLPWRTWDNQTRLKLRRRTAAATIAAINRRNADDFYLNRIWTWDEETSIAASIIYLTPKRCYSVCGAIWRVVFELIFGQLWSSKSGFFCSHKLWNWDSFSLIMLKVSSRSVGFWNKSSLVSLCATRYRRPFPFRVKQMAYRCFEKWKIKNFYVAETDFRICSASHVCYWCRSRGKNRVNYN